MQPRGWIFVGTGTQARDAHGEGGKKSPPARQEPAKGRKPPAADLGTLQPQSERAKVGPYAKFLDPERGTHLPHQPLAQAVLRDGLLVVGECAADLLDQRARAAQIDRALPAILAVAEPIIGTKRLAVAAAIGGGDVSLPAEQLRPGGNQP